MNETSIIAIISVGGTLLGVLITGWIATSGNKRRARAEREEMRRQQQTALLGDLLTALKRYSQLQFSQSRIIAHYSTIYAVNQFYVDRVGSEPMTDLWNYQRESAGFISRAQITIRNKSISAALTSMDAELQYASEGLDADLHQAIKEVLIIDARLTLVLTVQERFDAAVKALEQVARDALATDLA